jgi:hypothetical protein
VRAVWRGLTQGAGVAACAIGGVTLHSFAGIGQGAAALPELLMKARAGQSAARWRQAEGDVLPCALGGGVAGLTAAGSADRGRDLDGRRGAVRQAGQHRPLRAPVGRAVRRCVLLLRDVDRAVD